MIYANNNNKTGKEAKDRQDKGTRLEYIAFVTELSTLDLIGGYSVYTDFTNYALLFQKNPKSHKGRIFDIEKENLEFILRDTKTYKTDIKAEKRKELSINDIAFPVAAILEEDYYNIINPENDGYMLIEKIAREYGKEKARRNILVHDTSEPKTLIVLCKDIWDMPDSFFAGIEKAVGSGKYELPETILFVRDYLTKEKKEQKDHICIY